MFSLNTVLGTPTTQIISLVIAISFFSAVYAPLPTPGALGVPATPSPAAWGRCEGGLCPPVPP